MVLPIVMSRNTGSSSRLALTRSAALHWNPSPSFHEIKDEREGNHDFLWTLVGLEDQSLDDFKYASVRQLVTAAAAYDL